MPFQSAADLLRDMLGVVVSKAQTVRCTEAAGQAYVSYQNELADQIEREAPPARPGVEKLVLSADGAMVPLRHGEWAEAKTLAIGTVQPSVKKGADWVVHTQDVSYFSRLVDAGQFEHLSLVEMHRRGVEKSRKVAAVMDGADWLQSFVDYHCPDALRILDFAHAGQRIGEIGQALFGEGSPEAHQWTSEWLHRLKHAGPKEVIAEIGRLQQQHPELDLLAENLAYLEKRQAQMHYPQFQEQGWPIGSGMVESGNKLVVEARLKGAGMHWERANVNPLLGLRNILCSERWSEEWPLIANQLRQQTRKQRSQLRKKRRLAKASPISVMTPQPAMQVPNPIPEPAPLIQSSSSPKCSGERKPGPNHPWRHSPIGRALFRPSHPAKN